MAPSLGPNRWKVLALLCAAQFIVILDISIIDVAQPAIRALADRIRNLAHNKMQAEIASEDGFPTSVPERRLTYGCFT
jgi:hypothetical protein